MVCTHKAKIPRRQFAGRQRGAALFFAVMFLIVMTLLALAAANASMMQERMTGGLRSMQLASHATDSTLREVERLLNTLSFVGTQPLPPCPDAASSLCIWKSNYGRLFDEVQEFRASRDNPVFSFTGVFASQIPLSTLSGDDRTAKIARQPQYIVEEIGQNRPPGDGSADGALDSEKLASAGNYFFYRVTARGTGGTDAADRLYESVFSAVNLSNTGINAP